MAGDDDQADARLLEAFGQKAAALALRYYGRDPKSWTKGANSPVSEADIAVDRLLHDGLRGERPHYGWLSEETTDNHERLSVRRLFVIDPIDGTRAFLDHREDWTVSLAIVEAGRPVAACLIAPVSGEVFTAVRGKGAYRGNARLEASTVSAPQAAKVASPKAKVGVVLPEFAQTVPRIASLALRLTRVASSELDAAFAGPGAKDWDIAAADLIVREAGGRFSEFSGTEPIYNRRDPAHGALLAAGPTLHDVLLGSRPA